MIIIISHRLLDNPRESKFYQHRQRFGSCVHTPIVILVISSTFISRIMRALYFTFLFLMALVILLFVRFNQQSESDSKPNPHRERDVKVILYWTPMYRNADMNLGLGSKIFQDCEYKNCFTTYNKDLLPLDAFDAIIFHAREYFTISRVTFPDRRDPKQIYVFLIMETPNYTPDFVGTFNHIYNWTMTYRLDSDIVHPYGWVINSTQHYQPPTAIAIVAREKKIAWFVSHCKTYSRREELVQQISKYIPVDIYGNCSELKCSQDPPEQCHEMLEKNYKFYLSFENSICDDYITEKLYNVLKYNVIPIVYGGANYTKLTPPHSYIDVAKFENVSALVDYIHFLDRTPEEYLKYFEWKSKYEILTGNNRALCDLCRKLNENKVVKVYDDIGTWWFGPNKSRCTVVKEPILTPNFVKNV